MLQRAANSPFLLPLRFTRHPSRRLSIRHATNHGHITWVMCFSINYHGICVAFKSWVLHLDILYLVVQVLPDASLSCSVWRIVSVCEGLKFIPHGWQLQGNKQT